MTYVSEILAQMTDVFKPQQKAIWALLNALMCFSGRATMRNLARYNAGSAKRLRRWASQTFNFFALNQHILEREGVMSDEQTSASGARNAILIDATFLRKSGKYTEGLGWYHNGGSRALNKLERGLEMTLFSVGDLKEHTAYALSSYQNVKMSALGVACAQIRERSQELKCLSKHIVADGYYARPKFLSTVLNEGFELVTLLRHDSRFRYLYEGEYSGKGRPKLYAEKVDYSNLSQWSHHPDLRVGYEVYSHIVNYPAWKRKLLVVIKIDHSGQRRIICCTDLSLNAEEVLSLYELRFQIEFLFRDAKQHTGLGHAQTLDQEGQEHFANASFTALNLLRLESRSKAIAEGILPRDFVFSIGSLKLRKYNQFLLKYFFACLGESPERKKYKEAYQLSSEIGLCAA